MIRKVMASSKRREVVFGANNRATLSWKWPVIGVGESVYRLVDNGLVLVIGHTIRYGSSARCPTVNKVLVPYTRQQRSFWTLLFCFRHPQQIRMVPRDPSLLNQRLEARDFFISLNMATSKSSHYLINTRGVISWVKQRNTLSVVSQPLH